MISIYSLTPAPWGDQYRLVESFETWEQATEVLKALEKVNISFNLYKLVDWNAPRASAEPV
jgi:hypothetical protein